MEELGLYDPRLTLSRLHNPVDTSVWFAGLAELAQIMKTLPSQETAAKKFELTSIKMCEVEAHEILNRLRGRDASYPAPPAVG